MQTALPDPFRTTPAGRAAEAVLRKCVHCGFCLATCPTYLLTGDELDGPRGRIYLMKQALETGSATAITRTHLDRCLTCRACETTCPSGVDYHVLLDVGREVVEQQAPRGLRERLQRAMLRAVLPRRRLFALFVALGRAVRWLLPGSLHRQLMPPAGAPLGAAFSGPKPRKMLMLQGCVQPSLRPNINAATARVLAHAGIEAVEPPVAGCCGALRQHLSAPDGARDDLRRLIDAWWPQIEGGAEAIVITASGCGAQLRDAGRLLAQDVAYAAKAARIAALVQDVAGVVEAETGTLAAALTRRPAAFTKVAFHSPCTLQHGLGVRGQVELLLKAAGYELTPVADTHLCCGSAGTYSLLQPELARPLRERKLAALAAGQPEVIATANIGCQTHLAAGTRTPVRHWVELLDERLAG